MENNPEPLAEYSPPSLTKGTIRKLVIPSCNINEEDLRRLWRLLSEKAAEIFERSSSRFKRKEGESEEEFNKQKELVRSLFQLSVQYQASNGEWTRGTTIDVLKSENLPEQITVVDYDSAFFFNKEIGKRPDDYFIVSLDFRPTDVLKLTNVSGEPTENGSLAVVFGIDETWVNGVYDQLSTFFKERSTNRNWLHSHYAYDLLLLIFGFPMSLAWVYRANQWFQQASLTWPEALFVAFYVYVVLLALYFFRITFNYTRWIFPKVEGPNPRQKGPLKHRIILSALVLGLVSAAVYDFLKWLF